jgi:hypothetical protein
MSLMDSLTRLISFALFPSASTHLISTLLFLLNHYTMAPTTQLDGRDVSCPRGVSHSLCLKRVLTSSNAQAIIRPKRYISAQDLESVSHQIQLRLGQS